MHVITHISIHITDGGWYCTTLPLYTYEQTTIRYDTADPGTEA